MTSARIALTIALVLSAALALVGGLLPTAFCIVLVIWAGMILYLLPWLAFGMGLEVDDDRYLTGRTVSGRRTVDLERLTRVRRFRLPARAIDFHLVELVDADGVRLVANERTGNRYVRPVLEARLADAEVVGRGLPYLAALVCLVPPALIALVVRALT